MVEFNIGDRVELVYTSDADTALRPGDRGRVTRVTGGEWRKEIETVLTTVSKYLPTVICVDWDSGSTLAMLTDEGDVIKKVAD